jgi:NADH:ubiquinone oxidoreductase subunit D
MNTFYEHHKSSINFAYRCFDRILLNGLIQPFQQRGWIIPGGVRFDLDPPLIEKARHVLGEVLTKLTDIEALFFNSASTLARLEEIGTVTAGQALSIGLVGLAARASGIACDVRADFPHGIYRYSSVPSPTLDSGGSGAKFLKCMFLLGE